MFVKNHFKFENAPRFLDALSGLAGLAGSIGGMFGGDDAEAGGSQTQSGYSQLPEFARQHYEQIFGPGISEYFNSQQSRNPNPISPMNPYQLSALNSAGGGIQSLQRELPQYMNPYQQNVTDRINQNYQNSSNQLRGYGQMQGNGGRPLNAGAFNNSANQTLQSENEKNRISALAQADYQNYLHSLDLRGSTLNAQLNAGNQFQQQSQNEATSQAQAPLNRLQNLAGLLGQVPNGSSSTTTNPTAATPNRFAQAAGQFGAGAQRFNNGLNAGEFSSLWNPNTMKPGEQGPAGPEQQPGIFNRFNNAWSQGTGPEQNRFIVKNSRPY